MRKLRGKEIGFIFQDPLTSLNPTLTIGYQIGESIREHMGLSQKAARDRVVELLAKVGIPRAKDRLNDYPFQFSGGMRQRVMIAIALSCDPKLILADEPTTALDVTIQAQILELIQRLSDEFETAVLMITHDLGIAAGMCDRVNVMYAGRIVETGTVDELFENPRMPYAWGLLDSLPRIDDIRGDRLRTIEGLPPLLINAARRVPVRAALPVRARHLPAGRAGADAREARRSRCALLGDRARWVDRMTVTMPEVGSVPAAAAAATSSRSRTSRSTSRSGRASSRPQRHGQGGRRGHLRGPPGRDARPGRRVGLRQEHDRSGDDPAARCDRRARSGSTGSTSASSRASPCARCAGGCRSSSRTRTGRSTRG